MISLALSWEALITSTVRSLTTTGSGMLAEGSGFDITAGIGSSLFEGRVGAIPLIKNLLRLKGVDPACTFYPSDIKSMSE